MEIRGLGSFIILNGDLVLDRQLNSTLIGNRLGPGCSLDEGQGQVITIIWNTKKYFFRWNCGNSIVQDSPDVGQRGHRHGGTIGIAPLIGHEQNCIGGGGNGGIVVSLIQEAGLACAGLRGKCRPEKAALRLQAPAQAVQKCGVGCRKLAGKKFKVHIHPGITTAEGGLDNLRHQTVLNLHVSQHQFCPLCIKLT